jgi:PBP1b-binding outer membrane lipoprotein LpoB
MKTTLITLSALLLIGCGSRKVTVQKETVKEEVTQTVSTETKTDTNETVKVVDTSTVDEIEFVPIDNNRPIIYNGKEVFNAKIRHVKRKNGITTVSDKKVAQIKRNDVKTVGKREIKVKDKVTEREGGIAWWIWIVLIGLALLTYRYLRRTNVI